MLVFSISSYCVTRFVPCLRVSRFVPSHPVSSRVPFRPVSRFVPSHPVSSRVPFRPESSCVIPCPVSSPIIPCPLSSHIIPCPVSSRVIPCRVSSRVIPCHPVSSRFVPCLPVSSCVIPCRVSSCVIPCHSVSSRYVPCHSVSSRVIPSSDAGVDRGAAQYRAMSWREGDYTFRLSTTVADHVVAGVSLASPALQPPFAVQNSLLPGNQSSLPCDSSAGVCLEDRNRTLAAGEVTARQACIFRYSNSRTGLWRQVR